MFELARDRGERQAFACFALFVNFSCQPLLLSLFSYSQKSDIKALGHQDMSVQNYNRMPTIPGQGPTSRRHPLSNAAVNQLPSQASPAKLQEKIKVPSSPPLPRQNTKTTPPSPPRIITDKIRALDYHRVGFLGEVRCILVVVSIVS